MALKQRKIEDEVASKKAKKLTYLFINKYVVPWSMLHKTFKLILREGGISKQNYMEYYYEKYPLAMLYR